MEWARPPFAINHPRIISTIINPNNNTYGFEDFGEQFLENKYIMTLGKLLQLAFDLETYFSALLEFLVFQTKNFGKEN
jgi:hypothetical protein